MISSGSSSRPLVTIGVPVYNGEPFIRHALTSLLAQTYTNIELVISDNASTDGTGAICREFAALDSRVRYFRNEQTVTVIPNFWKTFQRSSGEYFMWTAVDDDRRPTVVAELLESLLANPRCGLAHGPVLVDLDSTHRIVEIPNRMHLMSDLAAHRVREYTRLLGHNAILFGLYRRDTLARAVFKQRMGHDYLLVLQLCLLGPVQYVSSPMITYRHRWGTLGSPMPVREPLTLRDLVCYRGVRRRKCWSTLLLGVWYLAGRRQVSWRDRASAVAAHIASFARRYSRELRGELWFLAFTPLMWVTVPLLPAGRRLKNRISSRRIVDA